MALDMTHTFQLCISLMCAAWLATNSVHANNNPVRPIMQFFATEPTILPPYVRDQRVALLAVTSAKRSALFTNTPTLVESGYKDFDISTWWGVIAPAKTPQATVAKAAGLRADKP